MKDDPFIAVHDYQHGAVYVRVHAPLIEDVVELLPPPSWVVYSETTAPISAGVSNMKIDTSHIDNPSDLLKKLIKTERMKKQGKRAFAYRIRTRTGYVYRDIWARSANEIEQVYPHFESMIGIGMNSEQLKAMGTSDIDAPDAFLIEQQANK